MLDYISIICVNNLSLEPLEQNGLTNPFPIKHLPFGKSKIIF